MLAERSFRRCRAKRGTGVGKLLTRGAHPADTLADRLRRRLSDRFAPRCRTAFRTDSVLTIYDHEIGPALARGAKCLHNRVHLGLKTVANEPGSHDDRRNGTDGAEPSRAMFSNFEADDLAIMNRRRVILNWLVGEHEPDLVVASRAVSVDGFHCSLPLSCAADCRSAVYSCKSIKSTELPRPTGRFAGRLRAPGRAASQIQTSMRRRHRLRGGRERSRCGTEFSAAPLSRDP